MKNAIIILFLSICFFACKKNTVYLSTKKEFKGISQTREGKVIPLFEFSSPINPQNIEYHAVLSYGTGTILAKINYRLTYNGQALSSASIENVATSTTVDFTNNSKNLIINSNFYGKRNNITYTYDNKDRLISSVGGYYNFEYLYDSQNNLEKVVFKNVQGVKSLEIGITSDNLFNPLKGIPLVYLEEGMSKWTCFSLSEHNITSLTYNYFDGFGHITDTSKYSYVYSYDEYNRPLKMRRYVEMLNGDNGLYEDFIYNY